MCARLFLCGCLVALAACGDDAERAEPSLTDYEMPAPRPLDAAHAVPLADAVFSVDARDVRYSNDGAVLRVAHLRLRELRLAGDRRSGLLLPARLVLDAPGRPRLAGMLEGRLSSSPGGALQFDASAGVGASAIAARGVMDGDRWSATVRLEPLVLADVHPFLDAAPSHGVARGLIALRGNGDALQARTDGVRVSTDRSRIVVAGAVARGAGRWSLDDVRLDLDPVHPDDWRAWFGSEPPVDAPLQGSLVANGDGFSGIDVDGWLLAESADGSRLAADVDGRVWLEPALRLDLVVESRALRLADRAPLDLELRLSGDADSLAIVASARLSDTDTATLQPILRALPAPLAARLADASLDVDAQLTRAGVGRRIAGTATLVDSARRTLAVVRGHAPVGGDGAIDVVAQLDSLPLALLPLPQPIENFQGYARATLHASGSIAAPALDGRIDLAGVRFDVPAYGTGIDSMTAGVRLVGDRIDLVDVRAYRAQGSLTLTGGVRLGSPLDLRDPRAALEGARVDVVALIDTMAVVEMDSARAVIAGRLTASGALERPHFVGTVAIVDGFAYEGKLAPNPPLDPADPPYSDLLATAPWPATRLRDAARVEEAAESGALAPLPLTADILATVSPDFRIIDEDSDLGVSGGVRLVVDERGTTAVGDAAIVDGFYAYYGELFRLSGGAFAVDHGTTKLAMAGILRDDYRPLGLGQGGASGFDRRDPPIGIFGYSTPATVLELLQRNAPFPATQPELASLLLFDVPLQAVDEWDHELMWRGDEPADLVGHRSAIQGAGLAWSYVADELYDYVPIDRGYLRAGTLRTGSRYPGWIMLGTQLEAGVHFGRGYTARATHVVGADAAPGVGLRYALRAEATAPADRHVELFNEPRFSTTLGTAGRREDVEARRRTGVRVRWRWDW